MKIEGSWDEVMKVIGQAHTLVHQGGVLRVQTDIRAGTRYSIPHIPLRCLVIVASRKVEMRENWMVLDGSWLMTGDVAGRTRNSTFQKR